VAEEEAAVARAIIDGGTTAGSSVCSVVDSKERAAPIMNTTARMVLRDSQP